MSQRLEIVKYELGFSEIGDLMASASYLGWRGGLSPEDSDQFMRNYWKPFEKAYKANTTCIQNEQDTISNVSSMEGS